MTHNITISKKEGDEITFKIRKVESFKKMIHDKWNKDGLIEELIDNHNKREDLNEDPNSSKVQKRFERVIDNLMETIWSNIDLSDYPVLWKPYEVFKTNLNGKKLVHFDKLSEELQFVLYNMFISQMFDGKIFPKGVIDGVKSLNKGYQSQIMVNEETYNSQIERCKKDGYSTQYDKYGKPSRLEIFKDGTLFEVDTCRPVKTLRMVIEENPEMKELYESGEGIENKIQKEVFKFYKKNNRSWVDFFEKCWTSKMEVFHNIFEREDEDGKIDYWNLEGIIPFCECVGFDTLEEDSPFIHLPIPPNSKSDKKYKTLFKYFPHLEKNITPNGTVILFSSERSLEGLLRSEKNEKELVG